MLVLISERWIANFWFHIHIHIHMLDSYYCSSAGHFAKGCRAAGKKYALLEEPDDATPTVTAIDKAFADFQKQEEKKRKKESKSKTKEHVRARSGSFHTQIQAVLRRLCSAPLLYGISTHVHTESTWFPPFPLFFSFFETPAISRWFLTCFF